jgi:predicted acylesterase/phospholipase RssA
VPPCAALPGQPASLFSRAPVPTPAALWEELDRFFDSLPAGFFTLDGYERFLEAFFVRRGIPNTFHGMPRPLRVMAHDLDSGEQVLFGSEGYDHVPVTRACIASLAVPPFFSPVRLGDRHYIDAGAAEVAHLDVAVEAGADLLVVVNPMVPVRAASVPTGHGRRTSVRDKGLLWVTNQALRIGVHALMRESIARIEASGRASVISIEPDPDDGILFMYNPASFAARRNILEYAYRRTRAWIDDAFRNGSPLVERAGWNSKAAAAAAALPENG